MQKFITNQRWGRISFVGLAIAIGVTGITLSEPTSLKGQTFESVLIPSDRHDGQNFGRHVGTSGDWAVVGAIDHDENGELAGGAAYFFRWHQNEWGEHKKITAMDGSTGFGANFEISDNRVVFQSTEQVLVYAWNGTEWFQEGRLKASDGSARFGSSPSISGNKIIVKGNRSVHPFSWDGENWIPNPIILPPPSVNQRASFPSGIAIEGDRLVVGSIFVNGQGSAYLYTWDGEQWTEKERIQPERPLGNADFFGSDIALNASDVLIGSRFEDHGFTDTERRGGVVYLSGKKIFPSGSVGDQGFGSHVALGKDLAFVSTKFYYFYTFRKTGDHWQQESVIGGSVSSNNPSMDASGSRVIMGYAKANTRVSAVSLRSGKVSIFDVNVTELGGREIENDFTIEFESISENTTSSKTTNVHLKGSSEITVSAISSTISAFSVKPSQFDLPPVVTIDPSLPHHVGTSSQTIEVTFSPEETGLHEATLVLNHDGTYGSDTLQVRGIALAVPPLAVFPQTSIAFGKKDIGSSMQKDFTIENQGEGTLTISNLSFSHPAFSTTSPPITVPPNSNTRISLLFKPSGPGAITSILSLTHNGDSSPSIIALSGEGLELAKPEPPTDPLPIEETGGFWTWEKGDNRRGARGVYGTRGDADSNNRPGARIGAVSWVDLQNTFWLFGGQGIDANGRSGLMNDLWKWNGQAWIWVHGAHEASTVSGAGESYGQKGVPSSNNVPGKRAGAVAWTATNGDLWLFGGGSGQTGGWNDLWRWDGANWTWISGDQTWGETGAHGLQGQASEMNLPSGRIGATAWSDGSGNFWLFGGDGRYSSSRRGFGKLNDLWRWDGKTWTWMSGDPTAAQGANYGTRNITSEDSQPGSRSDAVSWIDSNNQVWIFGGEGYNTIERGLLNDLWRWDGRNWTWMKGSNQVHQQGHYQVLGKVHSDNMPGARHRASTWTDTNGTMWLYGGNGWDGSGKRGELEDLWAWNGSDWNWVNGRATRSHDAVAGLQSQPEATNWPGSLGHATSWSGESGKLWLFGGFFWNGDTENPGWFNNLWSYEPAAPHEITSPPKTSPILTLRFDRDSMALVMKGEPGERYLIESTASLGANQWESVAQVIAIKETTLWLDPNTSTAPFRFYRATRQ
ncbi:MAG: choice-of-anchor D domain-containing protein [Verrucomicrobia bacterium]|jgi:hypothetical protein|nr:choice-of-anchor D domain-containing protein [Verrucomicrobiota bacterium]